MKSKHLKNAYKLYEERGGEINTKEDKLLALLEYNDELRKNIRDYEYEAVVKCKLSGEVIGRVFSFSLEGLEEELYKLKEAVKRDNKIIENEINEWETTKNYEQ